MVIINGEKVAAEGKTIAAYLEENGYNMARVVVEINLNIIAKEKYAELCFKKDDAVEILNFVGGG